MEKYINELLKKNNRLIIPDFGAFIQKQGEPNAYVFNEFLRYNDGLLADYIANAENIDRDKANEKISAFVKEVISSMDSSKPYSLGDLGSLIKDKNKKVLLISAEQSAKESKNEEKESPKEDKSSKKETVKNGASKSKSVAVETKPEVPVITQKEKDSTPNQPKQEQAPVINVAPDTKTEVSSVSVNKEPEKNIKPQAKMESPSKSTSTSHTTSTAYKRQSKNDYTYVWVIVILVLLGAAVTLAYLNKDKIPFIAKIFNKNKTEQVLIGSTTQMTDSISGATSNTATITELQKPLNDKKYYIVAGCFEIEANADAYVKKLQARGFNSSKFGKYNNLHTVSFESYNSWNDALMGLKKIRMHEQSEAWILRY